MEAVQVKLENELNCLRESTSSDFSAIAWMDSPEDKLIRWKLTSGKSNEKYKSIVKKPGRGLAGTVIRMGSPLVLDQTIPEINELRFKYSIMLAEKLKSAIGVPINVGGVPRGVLLIGSRSEVIYPKEVLDEVKGSVNRIVTFMNPSCVRIRFFLI